LAEGQSVVKVKEAVGHSDIATTMRYMHLVRENLEDLKSDGNDVGTRLAG
jgi:site-specific recombinase XerD